MHIYFDIRCWHMIISQLVSTTVFLWDVMLCQHHTKSDIYFRAVGTNCPISNIIYQWFPCLCFRYANIITNWQTTTKISACQSTWQSLDTVHKSSTPTVLRAEHRRSKQNSYLAYISDEIVIRGLRDHAIIHICCVTCYQMMECLQIVLSYSEPGIYVDQSISSGISKGRHLARHMIHPAIQEPTISREIPCKARWSHHNHGGLLKHPVSRLLPNNSIWLGTHTQRTDVPLFIMWYVHRCSLPEHPISLPLWESVSFHLFVVVVVCFVYNLEILFLPSESGTPFTSLYIFLIRTQYAKWWRIVVEIVNLIHDLW